MNRKTNQMVHNYELFPVSCQPSTATHQAQLSPLYLAVYNPPGFPFHKGCFHHPYNSTFQAHTPQACLQAAPLIGPCLFHQDSRQQEHGTQDCHHIPITSWPCRKMWKMLLATRHCDKHFKRWVVIAQTLPILITIPVLYISWERNLFLTAVYISTSAPTTPLTKTRMKCWKRLDWLWISFSLQ